MADLLIVDNDARIVELTAWFLERAGHTVRSALSYAEARGLLEAQQPELLLADLELGVERGREELPKLAAAGLLPRTLVVSGFLDAELVAELMGIPGVIGTLAKPVDLNELQERVAQAVASEAELDPVVGNGCLSKTDDEPVAEIIPQATPSVLATESIANSTDFEEDGDGWVEILPHGEGAGS